MRRAAPSHTLQTPFHYAQGIWVERVVQSEEGEGSLAAAGAGGVVTVTVQVTSPDDLGEVVLEVRSSFVGCLGSVLCVVLPRVGGVGDLHAGHVPWRSWGGGTQGELTPTPRILAAAGQLQREACMPSTQAINTSKQPSSFLTDPSEL